MFQSPPTISKVVGGLYGWHNGSNADLSSGHGASSDGCNAKGDVRSSFATNIQLYVFNKVALHWKMSGYKVQHFI